MDPANFRSTVIEDEGGQIAGWLVKLVVFILIGGGLVIETASVLIAKANVVETATIAASAAAFAAKTGADAEEAARSTADEKGAELVSAEVDTGTRTVTVVLRRKAKTLFIHNIDYFDKFIVQEATATRKISE